MKLVMSGDEAKSNRSGVVVGHCQLIQGEENCIKCSMSKERRLCSISCGRGRSSAMDGATSNYKRERERERERGGEREKDSEKECEKNTEGEREMTDSH